MRNDEEEDISGQFDLGDLTSLEAPARVDPDSSAGKRVADLCNRLQSKMDAVAVLQAQLEVAKADVKEIEEKLLPQMIRELGAEGFKTASGVEVEIKREVHASLPKKDPALREVGIKFLEAVGYGAIVEHVTSVTVGRDKKGKYDVETAKALAAYLEAFDRRGLITLATTKDVHHGTLAKAVREMREAGTEIPEKALGVFERDVAKVKRRK